MIIFMSDILCVTNRTLCTDDFLQRIERIAINHPAGIILREKDLDEDEYFKLARQVLEICGKYQVKCILHSFTDAAIKLHSDAIHLPLPLLREMSEEQKGHFKEIGTSCHSVADVLEAQSLGATYLTAGHIFATDCKKGLPGRGLDFLKSVCGNTSLPVYGIGGISPQNIDSVRKTGAKGACIMSGLMQCENVKTYLKLFGK